MGGTLTAPFRDCGPEAVGAAVTLQLHSKFKFGARGNAAAQFALELRGAAGSAMQPAGLLESQQAGTVSHCESLRNGW